MRGALGSNRWLMRREIGRKPQARLGLHGSRVGWVPSWNECDLLFDRALKFVAMINLTTKRWGDSVWSRELQDQILPRIGIHRLHPLPRRLDGRGGFAPMMSFPTIGIESGERRRVSVWELIERVWYVFTTGNSSQRQTDVFITM